MRTASLQPEPMVVFELTEDLLGLGRKGDRVVIDSDVQVVVHPIPFNPGLLLRCLTEGQVVPLSEDAGEILAHLVSKPGSARPGGLDSWRGPTPPGDAA